MGSEWPKIRIEDIQANTKGAIAIGPFGSRMKSDCYVDEGVPVIRGTNITGGPTFEGEFVYISEDMADSLGSCNVYKHDLVFPHRGSIGEVGIILDDNRYVISSSLMKLTCDTARVNPKFLYYFFKSHTGKYELLKNASQVGTPGIGQPLTSLKGIELRLPPLSIQNVIADVMSSLDDKIELNRQMNTTLEAMAQALFKSWFVDFDPVIDNALAAGNPIPEPLQARAEARAALGDKRKPLPEAIQQQFPSRFVFSEEMDWVPEGWGAVTFENLVEAKQGKYLAKGGMKEQPDDKYKYPVWGGNGILGYCIKFSYDTPTTLMTCRGSNCGLIKTTKSAAWVSNNSFACKSKYGSDYFLYLYFLSDDFTDCISGSAQPQITYTALRNKLMKHPVSENVCNIFSDYVEVYREKQFKNDMQIENFSRIRDTLLPILLSGQLRIPDAEAMVEQVAAG